jgi:hypothetical protein
MKVHLLPTLTALLLLAGCSTPPSSSNYTYRAIAGHDMDIILDNLIESPEDRSYLIWLNAVRLREGLWDSRYLLEVRYEGASDAGYLDLGPGETLIVTVDGQPLRFKGPGSANSRSTTAKGNFAENAVYEATPDDLRKIAKGKDVKVQVMGNARRLYREFKPENTQKFKSFVLTYLGY